MVMYAPVSKTFNMTRFGHRLYSDSSRAPIVGSAQLPTNYFLPQKLPIRIISPRPDTADALRYWRWATPDVPYKVRIVVQGGSPPFRVVINDAPAGMTVGGEMARRVDPETGMVLHEWYTGYLTLRWENPAASGVYNVSFTVYGQDSESDTVAFSVTCNPNMFLHLRQAVGNDSNDGSYATPLQSFVNGVWKNSDSDATFAGKILLNWDGTYGINSGASNTSPILDRANKPFAIMSVDGESPIYDLSEGHFRTSSNDGGHGLCVEGISFDGSRTDLANNRLFNLSHLSDDQLFWGCRFDNTTPGTNGNDNPACVFHGDDVADRKNVGIVDCEVSSGAAFQLWVGFSVDGAVVENNYANNFSPSASNASNFFNAKDTVLNFSGRCNYGVADLSNSLAQVNNQDSPCYNQELCYNRFYVTNSSAVANVIGVVDWNRQGEGSNMHDYRNQIVAIDSPAYDFNESTVNVQVSANAYYGAFNNLGSDYDNATPASVQLSAGDFDGQANMVGTARNTHLGLIGSAFAAPAV